MSEKKIYKFKKRNWVPNGYMMLNDITLLWLRGGSLLIATIKG